MDKNNEKNWSINLGLIIAILFAVPLFNEVPQWYVNIEIGLIIVALIFCVIGFFTQIALIRRLHRATNIADLPPSTDLMFSAKAITSWIMATIILYSLYHQGIMMLFTIYLVAVILNNILRAIRTAKQNKVVNNAINKLFNPEEE